MKPQQKMNELPHELLAEIAMVSAKTWASMLLVFRTLHVEYYKTTARERFVSIDSRSSHLRRICVDGALHSIDNQPARIEAYGYIKKFETSFLAKFLPRFDLFSGATKSSSRYLLAKNRVVLAMFAKSSQIKSTSANIIRATQAFYNFWRDAKEANATGTDWFLIGEWYKSNERASANGAFCVNVKHIKPDHENETETTINFSALDDNNKISDCIDTATIIASETQLKCSFNCVYGDIDFASDYDCDNNDGSQYVKCPICTTKKRFWFEIKL